MGDAGPTRGHSGIGVRSHIEEKSPKPMATVAAVEMWSQGDRVDRWTWESLAWEKGVAGGEESATVNERARAWVQYVTNVC